MSIEEILEKDRRAVEEAFCKGNFDALNEVYAPDAVFHAPALPEIRGLEEFKKTIPPFRETFTEVRFEFGEQICQGESAMMRFTSRMKHTGTSEMFTMPPTGKEVVYNACAVYHVKDNKIIEFFEYADMLSFFRQLGAIPSQ